MRATSTLTRTGAAAREQLRGASAVDSRTDEPRRRALHGQHSRANARETEQMCGGSSSGGAHFSMCTFDRAECTDGRVLAAGGAAIRGSTGRSSEFSDRVLDRNSSDANYRGRTFVMYHGTTTTRRALATPGTVGGYAVGGCCDLSTSTHHLVQRLGVEQGYNLAKESGRIWRKELRAQPPD